MHIPHSWHPNQDIENGVWILFVYLVSAEVTNVQAKFCFGEFWWEKKEAGQWRLPQHPRRGWNWNRGLIRRVHCVGMFCLHISFLGFPLLATVPAFPRGIPPPPCGSSLAFNYGDNHTYTHIHRNTHELEWVTHGNPSIPLPQASCSWVQSVLIRILLEIGTDRLGERCFLSTRVMKPWKYKVVIFPGMEEKMSEEGNRILKMERRESLDGIIRMAFIFHSHMSQHILENAVSLGSIGIPMYTLGFSLDNQHIK